MKTQLNNPQIKQLKKMYELDMPVRDIAKTLNVSEETTEKYIGDFCEAPEFDVVIDEPEDEGDGQ